MLKGLMTCHTSEGFEAAGFLLHRLASDETRRSSLYNRCSYHDVGRRHLVPEISNKSKTVEVSSHLSEPLALD